MPSRLRVVFGLDSFNIGGTELNAVRTAERLDRSRFQVNAIALRREGPLLERYQAAGIPVIEYRIPSLLSIGAVRQGIRLASWLRRERIDIVHTHDVYSNIFVAPWARAARVPVIIASRRWWFTVPRRDLIAANRIAYLFAHRVLANSESVAALLASRERVRPDAILTIPNFVDDDAFAPLDGTVATTYRAAWGLTPGIRSVAIIARLDPVKRHTDLLRAFSLALRSASNPAWRLVIVGDGPERASLEALTQSLDIAHAVCFAGMIPPTPGLPSLFDLIVLSSAAEGFPNSIVEAMAAGRAVVATRVGGVADCVVNDVTGVLVPASSPQQLADALARLLSNPGAAAKMGAAGRERALARYHSRVVLGMLESAYTALTLRHRVSGGA